MFRSSLEQVQDGLYHVLELLARTLDLHRRGSGNRVDAVPAAARRLACGTHIAGPACMPLFGCVLLALLALGGCASADPAYRVEVVDARPTPALSAYDASQVVGIAIDPTDETLRLVYSPGFGELGLVTTGRDGSAARVSWIGTLDDWTGPIVAMGRGQYAYLGRMGGHVLDTTIGETELRFCLLPGAEEGRWSSELAQESRALAYEHDAVRLWTQPRTLRDRVEPVRSEIAAFDAASGESLGWWTIDDTSFRADAMAALPDGRLLLADWLGLHAFDPESGRIAQVAALQELDLVQVRALVYDPRSGHVLALDASASGSRLVELELTRLD